MGSLSFYRVDIIDQNFAGHVCVPRTDEPANLLDSYKLVGGESIDAPNEFDPLPRGPCGLTAKSIVTEIDSDLVAFVRVRNGGGIDVHGHPQLGRTSQVNRFSGKQH